MLAATHFDNLLVLFFFAAAIFFQILTKAASKGRRRPPQSRGRSTSPSQATRPLSTEQEETDQERIRKFLEALGQPPTSKPPAPVQPRPVYEPRRVVLPRVGPTLPPLTTRPPDLPAETELPGQIALPQQIPPVLRAKTFRPTTPDAPFEVQRPSQPVEVRPPIATPAEAYGWATKPAAKMAPVKRDFSALLRSAGGLRDAIILREIFGPPRSMQPLDLQSL